EAIHIERTLARRDAAGQRTLRQLFTNHPRPLTLPRGGRCSRASPTAAGLRFDRGLSRGQRPRLQLIGGPPNFTITSLDQVCVPAARTESDYRSVRFRLYLDDVGIGTGATSVIRS